MCHRKWLFFFEAVLTLDACGKKYRRIVGATSSSYSQSFNTYLHVGLGKCTKVEKAKVKNKKASFKDIMNPEGK